jgi:hypothetical protein
VPENAAYAVHLEATFSAERRDLEWAPRTEERAGEVFSALRPPLATTLELSSVECRSSLCRLEILHASADDLDAFLGASDQPPPFDRAGAKFPSTPNSSIVYLGRAGSRFPKRTDVTREATTEGGRE